MSKKLLEALKRVLELAKFGYGGGDSSTMEEDRTAINTVWSFANPWFIWEDEVETLEQARERRQAAVSKLLSQFTSADRDALRQLQKATWDGDLVSKTGRDKLIEMGLAIQYQGWQVVSLEGLAVLEISKQLKER